MFYKEHMCSVSEHIHFYVFHGRTYVFFLRTPDFEHVCSDDNVFIEHMCSRYEHWS